MSIRFAGSRCVDERRRRRLAQEAEPESSPERRPAPRARTAHRRVSESAPPTGRSASPVESLLRPQLWFYILLAVIGVGFSGGAIWLGWRVDTVHPALSASLGLQGGLLGRTLVACHFLLAAQLGYVILWYRARSRKDFRGQYILWRWVEPTWLLLALASAIDGRLLIQELLLPHIPARIWHIETLCWMVPAAVLVLTTTRFLLYDIRGDRAGVSFVVLSGAGAAGAALTVLTRPLLALEPATTGILEQAGVHVWSLGALLSMLFHARYVIHVTNEAPQPEKSGRLTGFLRRLIPRMPRVKRAAASSEIDSAGRASAREPASRQSGPAQVDDRRPVAPAARPAGSSPPENAANDAPSDPTPPAAPERQSQAQDKSRIDPSPPREQIAATPPADDDESDPERGLSKKERRRLRKQRRQQQRSQQAQL